MRYHEQRQALDLEFPGGEQYEYLDVTPAEAEAMSRADSVGRFVNQQIKKHRFRKLNPDN
jgi:hypothetical protein